jgi:hypothetical protein
LFLFCNAQEKVKGFVFSTDKIRKDGEDNDAMDESDNEPDQPKKKKRSEPTEQKTGKD